MKQTSKSVILSDQRESKDLRTTDTAKILRFAALTQDDRLARLNLFAETQCEKQYCTARTIDNRPYGFQRTDCVIVGEGLDPPAQNALCIRRKSNVKPGGCIFAVCGFI